MTTVGHGVTVDLGLNVHTLFSVGLQPRNINLDIEVTNAVQIISIIYHDMTDVTYFETMASSGMTAKCLPVMMSRLPVVVTKTLPRAAASSMVVTS